MIKPAMVFIAFCLLAIYGVLMAREDARGWILVVAGVLLAFCQLGAFWE